MSKPYISVIIPAFNEEAFLPRCLESLQQQKNAPSFEVIVVDNNSTDDTSQVAKHFDVTLIHEPKAGVVHARNTGLAAARGEIIVSTDADTYFPETWLAYIANYFTNHPHAAGLAGHYHFVKGPLWARFWPVMGAVGVKLIYMLSGKTIYVSGANLSFRKKYFMTYNTNHTQGGDEVEVLKELEKHGPVHVTLENAVYTSSRRVNQGFLHSILITVGYYYMYNHWQTKRSGEESTVGIYPAIRTESRTAHWKLLAVQWAIIAGISFAAVSIATHHIPHIWKFSEVFHLF